MRMPDGFTCGHWTGDGTGCTVLIAPPGSVAGGEVRGGGPGTRESDLLSPLTSTPGPEAILLTGGSAYGLAAADGVASWLIEAGRGYPTPAGPVPLVSAAVLYDLNHWTRSSDSHDGRAACEAAGPEVQRGRVGAGTGATVGKVRGPEHAAPGGLGAASLPAGDATVVAIAAVNAIGDVIGPDGRVLAGVAGDQTSAQLIAGGAGARPLENTTLVCVCTDARLSKLEAHLVARSMAAGVARAVNPSATAFDGDFTACMASGAVPVDPGVVAVVAAEATTAAIRDAVTSAR